MEKWNYKTHKYDPYDAPRGSILYSRDDDAECECASCGNKMRFGDGYASLEIHNEIGFGYCVCKGCYLKELERRYEDQEKRNMSENENRCVCCGEIIPEGRQVCPSCEYKAMHLGDDSCLVCDSKTYGMSIEELNEKFPDRWRE